MNQSVDYQLRLDLLREALPYIQRFKGKTFVVKFSGKVTEDHDRLMSLAEELALLHQVGIRLCVVHGGGKQLSELAALHYPSVEEQMEEATLKKKKLFLKDQMETILRRYKEHDQAAGH